MGLTGKFENLGGQVLHDGSDVYCCLGTDSDIVCVLCSEESGEILMSGSLDSRRIVYHPNKDGGDRFNSRLTGGYGRLGTMRDRSACFSSSSDRDMHGM